MAIMA